METQGVPLNHWFTNDKYKHLNLESVFLSPHSAAQSKMEPPESHGHQVMQPVETVCRAHLIPCESYWDPLRQEVCFLGWGGLHPYFSAIQRTKWEFPSFESYPSKSLP
jgi:hypothetical protein